MEKDHNSDYGDNLNGSNPWNYNANGSEDITSHVYLHKLAGDVLGDYTDSLARASSEEELALAQSEVIARLEHDLPYLNSQKPVNLDLSTSRYYIYAPDVPFDANLSLKNLIQPEDIADLQSQTLKLSGLFAGFNTLEVLDPNHQPDEYSIGLSIFNNEDMNIAFVPLSTLLDNIIVSGQAQ